VLSLKKDEVMRWKHRLLTNTNEEDCTSTREGSKEGKEEGGQTSTSLLSRARAVIGGEGAAKEDSNCETGRWAWTLEVWKIGDKAVLWGISIGASERQQTGGHGSCNLDRGNHLRARI